ncbi:alpha-galactosidase [Plantibacter sp. YIM 135249]|uniref:alpha-galactosidase n=1 Tax=Plantibacter sp. YIM 135249 TaxID=3423918 RepID=UPI003D33D4FF
MHRRSPLLTTCSEIHLSRGGTSVVLDTTTAGMPTILHWGESLGALSSDELRGMAVAARPQRVSGSIDEPARLTVLPQESAGWQGTPGLVGSRGGRDFSPNIRLIGIEHGASEDDASVTLIGEDPDARLRVIVSLRIDGAGLLHQQLTLENLGETDYDLIELGAAFPLPHTATEVLDTTGRHLRERSPQRHALTVGRYDRESRKGRPGADATLLLAAGTPGFGFERGLVHAAHLAWSGNHRMSVERTITGQSFLRAAELLAAGEIRLAPGERYSTPDAIASWGDGLTALSSRFHTMLRSRPRHPSTPRPVTLNTWEAVYFDLDLDRLKAIADAGARVGAERFVLDDGWFLGRRDDTAGLGDWFVDEAVLPDGLRPLIDHVTDLGLQFGLWVEPEMVNPDSELARAHPDWILRARSGEGERLPVSARQQQVLDLSNPAASAYLLERLDALLTENDISYLKWDHNRDLLEAGGLDGRAAVHANVTALYRLFDELVVRHPAVEIESCASGGARVDLGILEHTDRIWTSDCVDPIERLTIQKYTNLLVPYELMGAHIGGPHSDSTGRRHDLGLRAGVAFPGHFGIEWDLSTVSDADLDDVAAWVTAHKRHRELLHTGRAVFADHPDPAIDVRGVVAHDRSAAVFTYALTASTAAYPAGPITFPGLDDARSYRVELAEPTAVLGGPGQSPLGWAAAGAAGDAVAAAAATTPVTLSGRALRTTGVQAPVLFPEQLLLIDITAVEPSTTD